MSISICPALLYNCVRFVFSSNFELLTKFLLVHRRKTSEFQPFYCDMIVSVGTELVAMDFDDLWHELWGDSFTLRICHFIHSCQRIVRGSSDSVRCAHDPTWVVIALIYFCTKLHGFSQEEMGNQVLEREFLSTFLNSALA